MFYFAIILLASISDRLMLSLLAPIVTSGAYLAFLVARYGIDNVVGSSASDTATAMGTASLLAFCTRS